MTHKILLRAQRLPRISPSALAWVELLLAFPLSGGFGAGIAALSLKYEKGMAMKPMTPPDLHSEDSVFRRLFSDERKGENQPGKAHDKMPATPAQETPIKVSMFLPSV